MLSQWIRAWLIAGTLPATSSVNSNNDLSSIYATNLICFAVTFFLTIQIPFYFWSTLPIHHLKTNLIIIHIVGLVVIPVINRKNYHLMASLLFYCVYGSYVCLSSLLADFSADTHLFFLLGLFVIPFIFPSHRSDLKVSLSLLYISAFMLIEWRSSGPTFEWFVRSDIKLINRMIFAVTCFVAAFQVHKVTTRSWKKEHQERANSESLLLNILPTHICRLLKKSKKAIAQYHPNTTILFADIEDFTTLSTERAPLVLVSLLDELFSLFDEICQRYHLEKIKTLGDGYMVVAGLDSESQDHPNIACQCAKEMRSAYLKFSTKHKVKQGIRIGINTGPIVSGVIGRSKYTFDVWGEAVNLAARMQSHAETDKIQVSETTFVLTKDVFNFSSKRQLFIKGLGKTNAYWLLV